MQIQAEIVSTIQTFIGSGKEEEEEEEEEEE